MGLFAVNIENWKEDFVAEEWGMKIKIAAVDALLPWLVIIHAEDRSAGVH